MRATTTPTVGHRAPADESRRMVSLGFDAELYPAGSHICYIFNEDDERLQVMARFVQSGLDANELVGYFSDTLTPEEWKSLMRGLGVKLPDELDGHQYCILEADSSYCPDGTFQIDRMLDAVAEVHHHSLREGFAGARVTGEATWARNGRPGTEDLMEYEARVNLLLRTVPTTAVCQYDARSFDGATLYGVLSVHPMMIVRGQVLQNPYYVEPEVFLAKLAEGSQV